jgi:DNA polymerase III epsilon subunit-like protein
VDENEELFFDHYVMPKKEIVSYLTQLTGITGRFVRHIFVNRLKY